MLARRIELSLMKRVEPGQLSPLCSHSQSHEESGRTSTFCTSMVSGLCTAVLVQGTSLVDEENIDLNDAEYYGSH